MSNIIYYLRQGCRGYNSVARRNAERIQATPSRVHHSIIGKYERDEVKPSIDVVKKIAEALDTTVGYLLGEKKHTTVLKDTAMLKRLNDLNILPDKDKEHILYALDNLIKAAKFKTL